MQVAEWMTRQLHVVRPLDSIQHARELMAQHRINQLPVVVDGRLVGIVTDRDLRDASPSVFEAAQRSHARHAEGTPIRVEAVMTPYVLTVGPDSGVVEAARLMRRERVGAIPVVEAERVIGMITRSDVLDAFVALAEAHERRT